MTVTQFPHSRIQRDSGASAVLMYPSAKHASTTPSHSPAASPGAAGHPAGVIVDGLTVLAVLCVFGAFAFFLLVIA